MNDMLSLPAFKGFFTTHVAQILVVNNIFIAMLEQIIVQELRRAHMKPLGLVKLHKIGQKYIFIIF